jgi:hypothetical protein
VKVCAVSGAPIAELSPPPIDIAALKVELEARTGCPRALQKLIAFAEARVCLDSERLAEEDSLQLMLVVDETPLFTWDVEGNPGKSMLEGQGSVVSSPNLRCDYCNVLTKEPIRSGRHYFRFIMHEIGDEQWCGLVRDARQAGTTVSGRSLSAWTYYCGRMHCNYASIVDGLGALHAGGRAVKKFKKLQPQGDVIGMLVDLDVGAVAFDLNGELQGACAVPKEPLWVLTALDTKRDRVELEKPSLADAPPANLDALTGALLDVSQGHAFRGALRAHGGGTLSSPSDESGPADASSGDDDDGSIGD